jgi:hypothetical protein
MEIHRGGIRKMNVGKGSFKTQLRLGAAGLVALVLLSLLAHAQTTTFLKSASGVKYPDYYDPPNQSKLRTLVQGAEATPEGKGQVRVKNVQIQSFRVTGELEGVVTAPDCLYDHASRTITSGGDIQAQTADGRLRFAGTGFLITLTNKSLIISNNFHTVIRDASLALKKP